MYRILKIKYPEGTIINTYGETYKAGVPEKGNGLYCGQHSVKRARDGCVFLFNNNHCNEGPPIVEKLKASVSNSNDLKIVWEYHCPVDSDAPKKFPSGGNVIELPDESIFVNTGGSYGKTFIVSPDKKILWSAVPERWNEPGKKWDYNDLYRASIIENKKEMERLVWNVGTDENTLVNSNQTNHPSSISFTSKKP